MTETQGKMLAVGLCVAVTALLYRNIRSIARLSVAMWVVVLLTVGWVLIAGLANFQLNRVLDFPPNAFNLSWSFFVGLGGATLNAVYDYGGYNNVCFFGGEVKDPGRIIPRTVLLSILAVAAIYLTMTITIMGVVPWREAINPDSLAYKAIVADFIQRLYGSQAATVMTVLILWTTFASIFAVMLGYSRVPYAAAADGHFFKSFARMHTKEHFPTFSLVVIGLASTLACWLAFPQLITALIVIQIIGTICTGTGRDAHSPLPHGHQAPIQDVGLPAAECDRARRLDLYSGDQWAEFILLGVGLMALGVVAYLWQARRQGE